MRWTTLPRRLLVAGSFMFTMTLLTVMAASESLDAPAATTLQASAALGLSPEALVAADLVESADDILDNIDGELELRQLLKTQQEVLQSATDTLSAASQAISDGNATEELVSAHAAALAAFQNAQTAVAAVVANLRAAALEGASPNALTALDNWVASRGSSVPPEFRIKAKSALEWKQVVGALRAEARAQRKNTELDPTLANVLSSLREDNAVIAAKNRLIADLGAVKEIFDQHDVVIP